MRKFSVRLFSVAVMAVILSTGSISHGALKLVYEGAFKVAAGYYESSLVFVAASNNADRTTNVDVPTLLTAGFGHSANDPLKEWYIPADNLLATSTNDTIPAASQVIPANGGTYVTNTAQAPVGMTLLNGKMYGTIISVTANNEPKGELKLGYNGNAYFADFVPQPVNEPHYGARAGGIATKYDETNTLIMATWNSGGQKTVYVYTSVKGSPNGTLGEFNWTTTFQFKFNTASANADKLPITYVVFDGTGYYVFYDGLAGHAAEATLDFYDSTVFTNGLDATAMSPSFSLNIDDAIEDGYDWNSATSMIIDMGYDPSTGRLYVIEPNPNGGRAHNQNPTIHILTIAEVPAIEALAAQNIDTNTVDMIGYISSANADGIICYWGTNDGVKVPGNWDNATLMTHSILPETLTNSVSGLTKGTVYYYRYFASNSVAGVWATNSVSFTTLGAATTVDISNATGANNVGTNSATLNGVVLGGVPSPHVCIYWGDSDEGIDKTAWNKPVIDMSVRNLGPFSSGVTGLKANEQYWYRCYGSNVNEDAWAASSTTFTTIAPSLTIDDVSVNEGASGTTTSAIFTVTISDISATAVSINYATADGTAIAGTDYVTTSGTLTIPAGNISGTISVTVNGNDTPEADKTFVVNLDTAVNVVITDAQGQGTIINDDFTYYIRGDGAGNDSNNGYSWATAWETIQKALDSLAANSESTPYHIIVQASSEAGVYDVANRNSNIAGNAAVWCKFSGGWGNVDATPTQTGYSRIEDNDGTVDEAGFLWNAPGNAHGQEKHLGFNRFIISNVVNGIEILSPNNLNSSDIYINLEETKIYALTNGVDLTYDKYVRKTVLTANNNVIIKGGLSGSGDGVYIYGVPADSSIKDSDITSSGGSGVHIIFPDSGNYGTAETGLYFADSIFNNCIDDGIRIEDNTFVHRNKPESITLERVRVENNGRYGVYRRVDEGNGTIIPEFTVVNSVISGNSSNGVYLHGENIFVGHTGKGSCFNVNMLNVTLTDNGDDGLKLFSEHTYGANTLTITNTIIANNDGDGINVDGNRSVDGPTIEEDYNDFFSNTGTDIVRTGTGGTTTPALAANDLTVTPSLQGGNEEPYRPSAGSLILDAGNPSIYPALDLVGGTRPHGSGPSMGAYETKTPPAPGFVIMVK